jgi:hypothetical protein
LRYQISEINPKINPSEFKRLKTLFYQLENLGKESEATNNIVEFKKGEKSIPSNNIREFKRSKTIA